MGALCRGYTHDNFQNVSATQQFTTRGWLSISYRYARAHRVGLSGLATDDYLMIVAAVCAKISAMCPEQLLLTRSQSWYTILIVCLNVIAGGGGSNLFLPEEYAAFTKDDIEDRIMGSKIVIVSEQVGFTLDLYAKRSN